MSGFMTSTATTFDGHTTNVTAVQFHCEGKWMGTGSEDGTIKIWDGTWGAAELRSSSSCQRPSHTPEPRGAHIVRPERQHTSVGPRGELLHARIGKSFSAATLPRFRGRLMGR
ncbi:MAG: hypothetical protein BJ554DRAFT_3634 [Olpidium bornovanus]|uniref:Uncharacterized protein n=1 Tax=Olpidium bornovanus TaxID=278681 RepID=A0A8H7ZNX5_9FUNG|nr:MAG: hypothetical protein BJ554DRAFT_3634 [Olpidium bornovanus]